MPKSKSKTPNTQKAGKSKPKKNQTFSLIRDRIIGLIFLILALGVLLFPALLPKSNNVNSKNPILINSKLLVSKSAQNIPVHIIIPKSDIDLKVVPAKIVDGYWELSDTNASYGLGSGLPGTASNTVIFAHARVGLFYNLINIKTGDVVYVFTKNKWYTYKVSNITAVYPNQKEVIEPTKKETLTLYTCTGFNDEKRLIVTAITKL